MSTITIPTPDEIRKRLRGAVEEARALRQLLRLAEAAERAERACERQQARATTPTAGEVRRGN